MDCQLDEKENILLIIDYLKVLNCNFDNWDEQWVKKVLLNPCSSRINLLLWFLTEFGCVESKSPLQTFASSLQNEKILSKFVEFGICKSDALQLIEGSADNSEQLHFWEHLCSRALKLKHFKISPQLCCVSNSFLGTLVESPAFQLSMASEGNLLPDYLKSDYKNWCKKHPNYSLEAELKQVQENVNNLKDEASFNVSDSNTVEILSEKISSVMRDSQKLLMTYNSQIVPWLKEDEIIPPKSELLGPLIRQSNEELTEFTKMLSLSRRVKSSYASLRENLQRNSEEEKLTATSVLQNLIHKDDR